MKKIEKRKLLLSNKTWIDPKWFVVVVSVFYFIFVGYLAIARHDGLMTQMNDLGNMVQPIYNTLHGRVMKFSNYYLGEENEINRLGSHANLIFFLFVPVYGLWADPKLLLLLQTALIASGAFGLWFLGIRLFGRKSWWSVIGSLAYVLNPVVHDINLYDFHAAALAMPLIIWACYFLFSRKYKYFYVMAFLVAMCKEDMPLIVMMMGVYLAVFMGERKKGSFLAVSSFVYFLIMVGMVMPNLRGNQEMNLVSDRFGYLGDGVIGVLVGVVTKPWLVLGEIFGPGKIGYIPGLLLGVAGVSFFAADVLLIAVPSVLINLLSTNKIMYQVYGFYYPAPIMAVVMVAMVVGLARIKEKKKEWRLAGILILILGLFTSYLYSPLPYSRVSSFEEFKVDAHDRKFEEIKKIIPKNASVTVQNNLGAHLANREQIITFPYGLGKMDYVLLDVTDPYEKVRVEPRQRNFVVAVNMSIADYEKRVKEVFDRDDYGVVYASDGYILFKKGESKKNNDEAYEMFVEKIEFLNSQYDEFVTEYGQEG